MTDERLHRKFVVTRVDGTDQPGGKHDGCEYFVLDLTHDHHAREALRAYANAARSVRPALADDLSKRYELWVGRQCQFRDAVDEWLTENDNVLDMPEMQAIRAALWWFGQMKDGGHNPVPNGLARAGVPSMVAEWVVGGGWEP